MAPSDSVSGKSAANLLKGLISMLALFVLVACAKPQWQKNLDNDIKKIEAGGWTYYETLGSPQEGGVIEPISWADGLNVSFFWRTDGVADQRKYSQEGYLFGATSYSTKSGDRFTFVFRKPKD